MEGRGLKLDTAADVQPFVDELATLQGVTDIRLSGNTFNIEAAQALAAAIAKHNTIQVRLGLGLSIGERRGRTELTTLERHACAHTAEHSAPTCPTSSRAGAS